VELLQVSYVLFESEHVGAELLDTYSEEVEQFFESFELVDQHFTKVPQQFILRAELFL